ncbi:DUF421 domain-containing protein [Paenibacillus athensensis]|uniref:YetF C-terminal domain-containing protein n=1 Tax=Paenibacillus athensensis TaxID=1967502 RepID=A0A4Y8Q0T5_9BACL|nr:DUF421 domain-containing protein [Paenibacillus athensensis]MCD1258244.1 DUF421 domain-containing protein [Paenibacillus athensensis]
MDILTIFFRTVLVYFVVFLMLRIMGKREIGKLSLFDLVISIMIAEIAVFVLEDSNKPLTDGLVPMLTLVLIQVLMAFLALKSRKLRLMFDGKPSVLIEKGVINREEMRKQRYNLDDLMMQLRQNRVSNVADVEFAILEASGKLSVLERNGSRETGTPAPEQGGVAEGKQGQGEGVPGRSGHKPEQAAAALPPEALASESLQEKREPARIRYEGLPLPLIMDGRVQDDNLDKLGKTRFWLKNQLQAKGVFDFKEVFFCSIDHRGRLYLDRKR